MVTVSLVFTLFKQGAYGFLKKFDCILFYDAVLAHQYVRL